MIQLRRSKHIITWASPSPDSAPSFEVPFGFAGGLQDRNTGLVHFGLRDYDPDIGRWVAKDPILFAGGDTDLYGYVQNDPVNWVDPDGLWSVSITFYGFGGLPGAGLGGTLTFGSKNGTKFFNLQAGVGVGGGIKYNPTGGPPPRSDLSNSPCGSTAAYAGFSANAGLGIGFGQLGAGAGANFAAGLGAKNEKGNISGVGPNGPGYQENNGSASIGYNPNNQGRGFGFGVGAGLGINVGASWR